MVCHLYKSPIVFAILLCLLAGALGPTIAAPSSCPVSHCIYLPSVTSGAPDTANLPGHWLERLNAYRRAAGLAPTAENLAFSDGAAKHVTYMLLNPNEFEHSETPGRPGYTPEGDRAARQSNLYRAYAGFTTANAIDGWMESLNHRYGMLMPELATTGFALGCDSQRCAAALNVIGGMGESNLMPNGVTYPGAGQRGVQSGVISWQFYPFDPLAVLTSAMLRDDNNNPVAITTSSPDNYLNTVAVKPIAPLSPGATYTVEMHVTIGSRNLSRAWSFQTRSPALTSLQICCPDGG